MVTIREKACGVQQGLIVNSWEVLGKPFSLGWNNRGRRYAVVAKCACGRIKVVLCAQLTGKRPAPHCKACSFSSRMKTHGDSQKGPFVFLYRRWTQILARCSNPHNTKFARYGGRGIKVCDAWKTNYPAFKEWALASGYRRGLDIDRRDNDGDYTPENCRWVTRKVNINNRCNTPQITAFGETKSRMEWVEDERCRVSVNGLIRRLESGRTPEEAITTPPHLLKRRRRKATP